MALTGLGTWTAAIDDTAITNGAYSGTVTVASSSSALVLTIVGWVSGSAANADPATWTVTLNGVDIQPSRVNTSFAASISFGFAVFVIDSPPAGAGLPLVVNFNSGSSRACLAHFAEIGGQATPAVVQTGTVEVFTADVTSLEHTHSSTTDGNAIVTAVGLRGGAIGTVVSTGSNSLDLAAQSGSNLSSDMGVALGHEIISPAGSVTHGFSGWSARRCSLIWVEIAAATGGSGVTGDASGALALSGSANGSVGVTGNAGGVLALSGSATASAAVTGNASGALVLAGSATASVGVTGDASGALVLAGSATGSLAVTGNATGVLALAGSATGSVAVTGNAAGALVLSGSATGSIGAAGSVTGDAAGVLVLAGSATGSVAVAGNAAGVLALAGAATGSVAVTGDAAGALVLAGAATGSVGVGGVATGTLALAGSATGSVQVTGNALGVLVLSGTATGGIGSQSQRRWAFPAGSANGGALAPSARGGIMSRG